MGPIPTTEDTQVEDHDIELGNLSPSYAVSSTPHTRIHKDHPIDHEIGDVKSSVQIRRMITSYSELGFLGAIYEGKTHQDLHTCLFACFLSQEEPKRVSKSLSESAWVESMQEELPTGFSIGVNCYTDSDFSGATLDRKSTTEVCLFLGNRLISWQCKKQTVVATSTTEAEYVAAASCCGQRSAEASNDENSEVKINVTIDGHSMFITGGSLRRHLKLADQDGAFLPQWRFLIHNILHCLSPKKIAWEQFSSNIAAAIICLATNRKFNFSRMIFEHMVSNISSPHKFLMYPRITSSPSPTPSPSPEPTSTQPSPTQPLPTQPSPTQPSPT
ncbi:hypothetical protein Tco_0122302 [Tanacetum coccineum]